MYSIGTIVYGINFKNIRGKDHPGYFKLIEWLKGCDLLETQYSGSGESPAYIGAEVSGIDVIEDTLISDIPREPTQDQINEFTSKYDEFIASVKELNDEVDEITESDIQYLESLKSKPVLFLTWGTS